MNEKRFKNSVWRKSYKCEQCDFAAVRVDNLRTHLKIHSEEKSNKCDPCDFASVQASNLRKHLRTHSGGAFALSICEPKLASEIRYLKGHYIKLLIDIRHQFVLKLIFSM